MRRRAVHRAGRDPMIPDLSVGVLHAALDGLAARQRVTADNIANLQTPGFLAGRTDFESWLRDALADGSGDVAGTGPTLGRSADPTRTDGNNVDLDTETVIAQETGLRYQLALRALDDKYGTIRTALRS